MGVRFRESGDRIMPDEQGRKETETMDTHDPYAHLYEGRFLWEPWLIVGLFVFCVIGLTVKALNEKHPKDTNSCPTCGQEICNG